ncbi:hypothetical protein BKA63DRAFT_492953 [Paraphoma chrysanthemicola]|nr:hypothetical protein BKA63DRAFT_492953 [Paraphoma chrysanthemicola]
MASSIALHEIAPDPLQNETTKAVKDSELLLYSEDWTESYGYKTVEIRCGFMGIRFDGDMPLGWPEGLHELHCDNCGVWDTDFLYEHLHLLLHFLGDVTMCCRGSGSQLVIEFGFTLEIHAPKSCWVHSSEEVLFFAGKIRKAYDAIQVESIAKNQCASPVIANIVPPYMAWVFHFHLKKIIYVKQVCTTCTGCLRS